MMSTDLEPKRIIETEMNFKLPVKNYHEFYRFYLTEHRNIMNRRLHFLGSSIGLYYITKAIRQRKVRYLVYGLVSGYACAWIGHFVFEKNKPASFKQPIYSFISDWKMFVDILKNKLSLKNIDLDKI